MRFIQDTSFSLKLDRVEELQQWLIEHDAELKASYPPGTRYIGAFVTVFGSNAVEGDFHVLEELESYGSLDVLAAAGKDRDGAYARLGAEMNQFIDFSRGAPWNVKLMKDVLDATTWNMPLEEPAKETVLA